MGRYFRYFKSPQKIQNCHVSAVLIFSSDYTIGFLIASRCNLQPTPQVYNCSKVRELLGWKPVFASFKHFMDIEAKL